MTTSIRCWGPRRQGGIPALRRFPGDVLGHCNPRPEATSGFCQALGDQPTNRRWGDVRQATTNRPQTQGRGVSRQGSVAQVTAVT